MLGVLIHAPADGLHYNLTPQGEYAMLTLALVATVTAGFTLSALGLFWFLSGGRDD